jgi:hypothetical protein
MEIEIEIENEIEIETCSPEEHRKLKFLLVNKLTH